MRDQKKTVLEAEALQQALGWKGGLGRWLARRVYKLLELDEVNRIHAKYSHLEGPAFSEKVLEEVGVSYMIPPEQLERIPREGGFITVSNHPFGSIDGMILSAVVGSRRPDYRILTTFLLSLIPSLKDSFIPVDNFSSGGARSISGIRSALGHLAEGHPLGLFPAGEVATWQKGKTRTSLGKERVTEDIPWADNIVKLIRKSGFPVIPIYFDGENSPSFHRLGRIHPRLRTVRLIHEVFNKKGTVVQVRIGQPVTPAEIAGFDVPALGRYLRNRCYALEAQCKAPAASLSTSPSVPLSAPVPAARIREEIQRIPSDRILFETGDYRGYLLSVTDAPEMMKELYRLREETFRAIGEGTGQAEDTDSFDAYYRQMVLWNIPNGEIVGAYRLGFGPEILERHGGVSGFYTSTLFRYGEKGKQLLAQSLELGRSFIVRKYQREVLPLRLLFAGLAVSTLRCPGLAYFAGPVSISNEVPNFYKSLIVHYFQREFSLPEADRAAMPTHPFETGFLRVDPEGLIQVPTGNVDAFDRLLGAISDGKYRLPVLVRKYFSCGARLACFNVDPDFSDCLDGLIFLRYSDFPQNTTRSFLRGFPEEIQEAVWRHFYGTSLS